MITQKPPFKGNNILETQAKIFHRTPDIPSKINPDIPHTLESICLKALQKEKSKRYQDTDQIKKDLTDFMLNKPLSQMQKITQWLKKIRG